MNVRDDRTIDQEQTHTCIVAGTDSLLSGWGKAQNGFSIAGWACTPNNENKVLKWVKNRGDMYDIGVFDNYINPVGPGDCHIYVVTESHPSLK